MIEDKYLEVKEAEIIKEHSEYFQQQNPKCQKFLETYINVLKKCKEMGNSNPLTRERSAKAFEENITFLYESSRIDSTGDDKEDIKSISQYVFKEINDLISILGESSRNEDKCASLKASKILIDNTNIDNPLVIDKSIKMLDETDYRVKMALSELVATLIKKHQKTYFMKIKNPLVKSLQGYFEQSDSLMQADMQEVQEENKESIETKHTRDFLLKNKFRLISDINLGLEAHFKILEAILDNLNLVPLVEINQELVDIIIKGIDHSSKEINALAYSLSFLLKKLIAMNNNNRCMICGRAIQLMIDDTFVQNSQKISKYVIDSLQNPYSVVRLASTKSVIHLIQKLSINNLIKHHVKTLAPRICFNRRYVASGVSQASHDAWNALKFSLGMDTKGKEFLNQYALETIEYYQAQLKEKNHEIIETAFGAFDEIFAVLENKAIIKPILPDIINLMLSHAKDNKPSVRSGTFQSLKTVIQTWPEESKGFAVGLAEAAFLQLNFNWKSEEAAELIADFLASLYMNYEQELNQIYSNKIKDGFSRLKNPNANNALEEGKDINNPMTIVYKNWEMTNGILILLRFLGGLKPLMINSHINGLVDVSKNMNYDNCITVKINVWKVLIVNFKKQSKNGVKSMIEPCLEEILKDCSNKQQKDLSSIACELIKTMATIIGPNILKGRSENMFGDKYSQLLDNIIQSKP